MSEEIRTHALVVGSGFAGLGMAIAMKQAGMDDFLILEAAEGVGGTWRDNHYPGAACDVESHLYSFSFRPKADWSRMYAPQREILGYLEECVDAYGLGPHLHFGRRACGARYDARARRWKVETEDGTHYSAAVLISGTGGLSRPAYPDIAGLDSFGGATFHSARWSDDVDLRHKRVGVIGTGASAIQIVPEIASDVRELTVFQRSAPWIVARPDRAIGKVEQALFRRMPALQLLARKAIYLRRELLALGFVVDPRLLKVAERMAAAYLAKCVPDLELRRKLTPDYRLGCKRVLLSNDYYQSLQRPNVQLETEAIERIEPRGVVTRDGRLHDLDVLVLATGFAAAEAVAPFPVRGVDGSELDALWQDGAEAYLGTTVARFPNLFTIVGPNTGLGHSSMVFMIESQIAYILDCLRQMRRHEIAAVTLRPEIQRAYNRDLAARLERTVWASGCRSWYRTASGKNTTLWPGFTFEFWWRTRHFDLGDYELEFDAARDERPETRRVSLAN
ncbi:MAG: NAD(P)/FAD-dependent oxidoreductase [Polyangiaceae bacterium]